MANKYTHSGTANKIYMYICISLFFGVWIMLLKQFQYLKIEIWGELFGHIIFEKNYNLFKIDNSEWPLTREIVSVCQKHSVTAQLVSN